MSNSFGANGSLRGQRANQIPTTTTTTTSAFRATESNQRSGRVGGGGGGGGAGGSNAQIAAQRKPPARLESYASVESNWSGDIGKSPAVSLLSSSSSSPSPESIVGRPRASVKSSKITASTGSGKTSQHTTTSNTQRLSSIEILTENKQRQLQLEQQESFKQHLEQRQRYIQQQAHEQQGAGARQSDADALEDHHLISAAYRVDTSAPEYVRMAQAAAAAKKQSSLVNPFNTSTELAETRTLSPKHQDDDPSTVSGRSGFLATLMGATTGSEPGDKTTTSTTSKSVLDEELANDDDGGDDDREESTAQPETRYTKVAQSGERSYNYEQAGAGSELPFYRKDLGTLLADCRDSRRLVILIVAVALLLDNMLLTAVVPIIPAYLYKLRVEREHRQVLGGSPVALNKSSPTGNRLASLDINRNGRLDDDEIEAELARRINESISGLQDRFSGSFFHPRVVKNRPVKSRQNEDDDDDDEDGDEDERPPRRKQKVARYPRQASRLKLAPKPSMDLNEEEYEATNGDDDDDDDKDNDDDDGQKVTKKNGKNDREQKSTGSERKSNQRKLASTTIKPTTTTMMTSGVGVTEASQEENDDDDDEDLETIKKWTKLRESLMTMAEMSGNDTDALAGMCLSMVMGRPGYFAGPNAESQKAASSKKGRGSRRPKVERVRPAPVAGIAQPEAQVDTTTVKAALVGDDEVIINHQDIVDESFEVGVMFASKPIVQALANPFVGAITNRVGFTLPMFLGFTIMFLSTLVFAFGSTYTTLFMARAIQGVGSACTSVAGMSMIADRFPDDAERGNAMAVALGGLALGVVIGPPFGGFMYEFFGKPSPFIVLAMLALLDGLLQLLVLQPRVSKCQEEGASLLTLIKDPYILVAAGAITFANTGIGILEPALPLWMMDTMQAKNWEQGVAFLPAALSYLFSTNLFGNLGLRIGRWRSAMLGLVIIGCSLLLIPFASRVDHLILPNGAIGFAIGMVDSTMMPMLGYLVDIRHTSVYGSVYAIGDVAFCASFVFGPALSGTLVELIGFEGLIITTALICFAFAPLLILLKNPPARALNEAQAQEQSTLRYVNYNHLDSPDEEAQQLTGGRLAGSDPKYHHYQQNNAPTAQNKSYQAR